MEERRRNIYRVKKKDSGYSIIDNTGPNDERLTWGAKGLLVYMLTKPDDWTFYRDELAKHAADGVYKLRQYLKELRAFGYLSKEAVRDPESKKIIRWETVVHEVPAADAADPGEDPEDEEDDENQETGERSSGSGSESQETEYRTEGAGDLLSEKPACGKASDLDFHGHGDHTLLITDGIPMTDGTNSIMSAPRAASLPEVFRPTALLFLSITGKTDLSEDDAIHLRLLNKIHTPAAVQKSLLQAVDRIQRNGSVKVEEIDDTVTEICSVAELPIRYVYNAMKNYKTLTGGSSSGGTGGNGRGPASNPGRASKDYARGSEELFANG